MKSVLITGITGQDGSYLAELLLSKDYRVYGLNRRKALAGMDNLQNVVGNDKFSIIEGDLLEESRLNKIVKDIQPDEVYHLAAQSFVPYSWTNPIYSCDVNALGVVRLLEALRTYSPDTKFYQASSSEIFGKVQDVPQNEMTYQYPRSPYGCAKSFGFNIARNYRESYGIFVCNGILFNHESERRGLQFVTRKITRTIAEIKLGLSDKLTLGNLDAKRDWGYAPDFVRSMWMMMQYDKPDDYVIATGKEHSVQEFVEAAFKIIDFDISWEGEGLDRKGIVDSKIIVDVSERFYRPAEVDYLKGDYSKAKETLGWEPEITFEEMIERMVERDINQLRQKQE